MNLFLRELSKQFSDDMILLCCDNAAWHKSSTLVLPENIVLFYIPPYTPEMNPIEQIGKNLQAMDSAMKCLLLWKNLLTTYVIRFVLSPFSRFLGKISRLHRTPYDVGNLVDKVVNQSEIAHFATFL